MPMKLYTVKVMANCLDLSERRVRQLREEGILIEAAPGLYELWPNVRRYINFLRGNADGKADLNEERAKLTREKRIAAEQENKVKSGELYRKQDIMLGLSTMLMNLRSRMMALPNKLAPSIAKLGGNEDEIQDVLRDTFYEILDEFSHYDTALESPKEDEDADDGT